MFEAKNIFRTLLLISAVWVTLASASACATEKCLADRYKGAGTENSSTLTSLLQIVRSSKPPKVVIDDLNAYEADVDAKLNKLITMSGTNDGANVDAKSAYIKAATGPINDMATIAATCERDCGAQYATAALALGGALLMTAGAFPPAGPILALAAGLLNIIFGMKGNEYKEVLTIKNIRQAVGRELRLQDTRNREIAMQAANDEFSDRIDYQKKIVLPFLNKKNSKRAVKAFKKHARYFVKHFESTFVVTVTRHLDTLRQAWEAAMYTLSGIQASTSFADSCTKSCPIDGWNKDYPKEPYDRYPRWPKVWSKQCKPSYENVLENLPQVLRLTRAYRAVVMQFSLLLGLIRVYFEPEYHPKADLFNVKKAWDSFHDQFVKSLMQRYAIIEAYLDDVMQARGACRNFYETPCEQRKDLDDEKQKCGFAEIYVQGTAPTCTGIDDCELATDESGTELNGFTTAWITDGGSGACPEALSAADWWLSRQLGTDRAMNSFPSWEVSYRSGGATPSEMYGILCGHPCSPGRKNVCVRSNVCATGECSSLLSQAKWSDENTQAFDDAARKSGRKK